MKSSILISMAIVLITGCTSPESKSDDAQTEEPSQPIDLIGAWKSSYQNDSSAIVESVMIINEGYFSEAVYLSDPAQFIETKGGAWSQSNGQFSYQYEFFSSDTAMVGQSGAATISMDNNGLTFNGKSYERLDDGTPGALADSWLITGRSRNGELSRRQPGERKTMKILSGTRFQWIAYHTGTGRFSGTGGGSYTTIDGKYTENIEFFSRNNDRVGASLEFDYAFDNGEWYHSGLSSKGDAILEIWTPRSMLE